MKRMMIVSTVFSVAALLIQAAPPEPLAQQEVFEGTPVNVEPDPSMITAANANGEQVYTPETEVHDIRGLTAQSGASVRISLEQRHGYPTATQIEVLSQQ